MVKILLHIILPLIAALIAFNLIKIGKGYLISGFGILGIAVTILNYLIPLLLFIFVSIKIIPIIP